MFERSIKYIILLILNIIILLVLYLNQSTDEAGVFDTQFVISLLEERDKLQSSLIDEQMQLVELEKERKVLQADIANLTSGRTSLNQALLKCEENFVLSQSIVKEQRAELEVVGDLTSSANCDLQSAKLKLARQELAATQVLLDKQKAMVSDLENALEAMSKNEAAPDLLKRIEDLEQENKQLKADIENPIYLQSVYMSGRKCAKPAFDELVCLQEILLRPMFSKAPTTQVTVRVYAPNGREVSKATFSSKRAQLYRLPLGRGRELLAGEFSATFEVEDELLRTDGHSIVH